MLRNTLVFLIIAIFLPLGLQSPFNALLFYIWYAYFRPDYWAWSPTLTSLNVSFFVGLLVVVGVIFARQKLRFDLRVALLTLFLFHSFLSAFVFSEHQAYSSAAWEQFAKSLLITYFVAILVNEPRRLRLVVLVMAVSLGFEAVKQGWAQFILNPGAMNSNEYSFLGDNNGVALGMMMLVPLFAALAQTARTRWERYFHYFMLSGTFLRGISTYSRGGFLAALAVGIVYLLRSRNRFRVVVGGVVLAGLVLWVMPDTFWDRIGTIPTSQEATQDADESTLGRLHFWNTAVRMAAAHPFTGVGFRAYSSSYDAYDDSRGEYGHNRSVHSAWFGVLGELGFPGLLLFLWIFGLAILQCERVARATRNLSGAANVAPFALAFETSLVAYLVGATFLPAQYGEMYWHFIGLTIALSEVCVAARSRETEPVAARTPPPLVTQYQWMSGRQA